MNIIVHPFFVDGGEGYLAAMAQIQLMEAYGAAGAALIWGFLPWWRQGAKWVCLGFALISAYLVMDSYRGNQPLPWNPVVLFFPLTISLTGLLLSWKGRNARPW